MPAHWHYRNAGDYLTVQRKVRAALAVGRSVRVGEWPGHDVTTLAQWRDETRRALDRRINLKAGLASTGAPAGRHGWERVPRKWEDDYQRSLVRDCNTLHDYLQRRIVRRGSGFETREMRKRFADFHAYMREPID